MTKPPRRLVVNPPTGLRERARADGTVRLWWEPSAAARARGARPVELDANRLTWSVRKATELNREPGGQKTRAAPVGQTINLLIDDYTTSQRYRRLRDATRKGYDFNFRAIRAKWGPHLVADFSKPVMATWYETLFDDSGEWMALSLLRSMSLLFAHAELRGWRAEGSNPCQRLGMSVPKGRRRVASWAELDALVAAADRLGYHSVGHACVISTLQGQRQTDIITAQRGDFREVDLRGEDGTIWIWQLTRSKRGNAGTLALHPETIARLADRLANGPENGHLLIDERTGQPYSVDLFGHRFVEVRTAAIKAGCATLKDMQFRDLRRTFGAFSRAGGAGKDDVGDVLGNSAAVNQHLADIYMAPQLLTGRRAVASIQRPRAEDERKKA